MKRFEFNCTAFLGYSHCGCVTADGHGSVEISEADVDTLISLIRESGSTDIEEIGLEERHPDLYKILDEAYYEAALDATIAHWYMTGFQEGIYEYDVEELMEYCREHHGFEFEYNEEDYLDEDGELDEETLQDDMQKGFFEWLEDFVYGLETDEMVEFLSEHMNADVDTTDMDVDYQVEIPEGIIELA